VDLRQRSFQKAECGRWCHYPGIVQESLSYHIVTSISSVVNSILLPVSWFWSHSSRSLVPGSRPLTKKRIWWLLSVFLAVLSQQSWFWTIQWNNAMSKCVHNPLCGFSAVSQLLVWRCLDTKCLQCRTVLVKKRPFGRRLCLPAWFIGKWVAGMMLHAYLMPSYFLAPNMAVQWSKIQSRSLKLTSGRVYQKRNQKTFGRCCFSVCSNHWWCKWRFWAGQVFVT